MAEGTSTQSATALESLPISVLVPTRNSMSLLPRHVEMLNSWSRCCQEVVVVDSYSTDGTWEFLREHLKHPCLSFHQCPPGLYESWNHGIRQLRAAFTYVSTVGDSVAFEGIKALTRAQELTKADVVLSPPRFVTPDGNEDRAKRWPVHDLWLSRSNRSGACSLRSSYVFLRSVLDAPQGLLGSSAANLYRTECLQSRPFPDGYGHFGDTAWVIKNAFDVEFALLPQVISTFTLHGSGSVMDSRRLEVLRDRLFDLGLTALSNGVLPGNPEDSGRLIPLFNKYPAEFRRLRDLQEEYTRLRKARRVWILSAAAWAARLRRNRQRGIVSELRETILSGTSAVEKDGIETK